MSDAVFLPDDFTETLEVEAKLAHAAQGMAGDPFSQETSSPHNGPRSPDNAQRSPHNEARSPHSEPNSPPLVEEDSEEWTRLMTISQDVRERGRTAPEKTRDTILKLCEEYFLTTEQFGKLLGLRPKGIRDRFLTPLFNEGALERRFPHIPNHEQQAYRKKS